MLIHTCKVGETLVLGDNVKVTVSGVKGKQVHIGVDAPRNIAIHREEVHERTQKENGA